MSKELECYLPTPVIEKNEGAFALDWNRPSSIGRVSTFLGNFGMHVRAYAYILSLGPSGIRHVAERCVLTANFIRAGLKNTYNLPYDQPTMHEVIFDDRAQRSSSDGEVTTLDIAKRLIDYATMLSVPQSESTCSLP